MKKFALTRKARNDLIAIAVFTEEHWGKTQRNLYLKQFDDAFRRLAARPSLGSPCDFIKPGYRKISQGSHIIFYRKCADDVVEIVRILHKNMDVETRL